jgi:hypothetical protein
MPESMHLIPSQRIAAAQRVEPGNMECLIGVDVADPGDKGLIEQERFQHPVVSGQAFRQQLWRKSCFQGLGSKRTQKLLLIRDK